MPHVLIAFRHDDELLFAATYAGPSASGLTGTPDPLPPDVADRVNRVDIHSEAGTGELLLAIPIVPKTLARIDKHGKADKKPIAVDNPGSGGVLRFGCGVRN